ncbi:MAG TPA: hypothetical protein VFE63_06440 [Roseiarcus sp.]|nr:hypothetical protein [Roseiarcus sp.]
MIEQGRDPSSDGAEREAGAWRWVPVSSSGVIGIDPPIGAGDKKGGDLNKLLVLLVAVTLACGVAAGVTMNLAPAYADGSGDGY